MPLNGPPTLRGSSLFAYHDGLAGRQAPCPGKKSSFFFNRLAIKGDDFGFGIVGQILEDFVILDIAFVPQADNLSDLQMMAALVCGIPLPRAEGKKRQSR